MTIPEIGASMADATRTRENEGPCICDGCGCDPDTCDARKEDCRESMEAEAGDLAVKARKERDL